MKKVRNLNDEKLPSIAVAPNQGKMLQMLCDMMRSKSVLEIGTLGGYSTLWFLQSKHVERVVTMEVNEDNADIAKKNFGEDKRVQLVVGPALNALEKMEEDFDFVFIDADKVNNLNYLNHSLRLCQNGLIVLDNVVRGGNILNLEKQDPSTNGTRAVYDYLETRDDLDCTAIQTVGEKGHDGLMMIKRKSK